MDFAAVELSLAQTQSALAIHLHGERFLQQNLFAFHMVRWRRQGDQLAISDLHAWANVFLASNTLFLNCLVGGQCSLKNEGKTNVKMFFLQLIRFKRYLDLCWSFRSGGRYSWRLLAQTCTDSSIVGRSRLSGRTQSPTSDSAFPTNRYLCTAPMDSLTSSPSAPQKFWR